MCLPPGEFFLDTEGVRREKTRIAWWVNPAQATFQELGVQPGVTFKENAVVPPEVRNRDYYGENERPVFFGHYWLMGIPKLIRSNVCCLDFSVAGYQLIEVSVGKAADAFPFQGINRLAIETCVLRPEGIFFQEKGQGLRELQ